MQDRPAQDMRQTFSPPTPGVLSRTKKALNGGSDVLRQEGVLEPASRIEYILRELVDAVDRSGLNPAIKGFRPKCLNRDREQRKDIDPEESTDWHIASRSL
jgi:hypothetical protein